MSETADYKIPYDQLSDRLRRIEKGIFNTLTVLAVAAHGLGLFLGFLVLDTEPDSPTESLNLLHSVFGLSESGIGELERNPVAGGIPLAVVLVAVLFSLATNLLILGELTDGRLSVLKASTAALTIATIGAWIFVFLLASESPDMRALSPATWSLTAAVVVSFVVIRLGDYILYNDVAAALVKKERAA